MCLVGKLQWKIFTLDICISSSCYEQKRNIGKTRHGDMCWWQDMLNWTSVVLLTQYGPQKIILKIPYVGGIADYIPHRTDFTYTIVNKAFVLGLLQIMSINLTSNLSIAMITWVVIAKGFALLFWLLSFLKMRNIKLIDQIDVYYGTAFLFCC